MLIRKTPPRLMLIMLIATMEWLVLEPPPLKGQVSPAPIGDDTAQIAVTPAQPWQFRVTFDRQVQTGVYAGRVLVVVSDQEDREPRLLINRWFNPPYLFAQDITNVGPGKTVIMGNPALSFPVALSELPAGQYQIQAVARRSLDYPVPGQGPGDLYSDPITVTKTGPAGGSSGPRFIDLRLNHIVKEESFEETDRVKLAEMVSPALSKFHGRPIKIRAAVILPPSWKVDGGDRYPVLYFIPGFGGSHRMAHFLEKRLFATGASANVLVVVPDSRCYRGHHAFADSDTNGPWGTALEELIPYVESRFRGANPTKGGLPPAKHRYVMGVSSGGWSALWLQITYPDQFNGCWSHCPDPVDFRDFQQIDLYKPGSNMFVDENGRKRPLARRDGKVMIEYEDFIKREEVLGPGGQIRSFEAVFSRRRPDGTPEPMFDAMTGRVNTNVARSWERFDIRLVLERNWSTLGPKLSGKLHIYAGEVDTFYLEGAVALLKTSLKKLGSDAEVIVVPGMAHGLYRASIEPMLKTIVGNLAPRSSKPKSTPE